MKETKERYSDSILDTAYKMAFSQATNLTLCQIREEVEKEFADESEIKERIYKILDRLNETSKNTSD